MRGADGPFKNRYELHAKAKFPTVPSVNSHGHKSKAACKG
jgi:hypothetical protein